jgi:hypothetical protein
MAVAMVYPEGGGKGGRGKKADTQNSKESFGFSEVLVRKARLVLQWAPELSKPVLSGATALDEAYETATDRRNKAGVYRTPSLPSGTPQRAFLWPHAAVLQLRGWGSRWLPSSHETPSSLRYHFPFP